MSPLRKRIAFVLLGAATLAFMGSVGGGFVFAAPILLPLHWWAAHHSGRFGTILWALAAALLAGEVAWAATYAAAGEASPLIWAVPIAAGAATFTAFVIASVHGVPVPPRSSK